MLQIVLKVLWQHLRIMWIQNDDLEENLRNPGIILFQAVTITPSGGATKKKRTLQAQALLRENSLQKQLSNNLIFQRQQQRLSAALVDDHNEVRHPDLYGWISTAGVGNFFVRKPYQFFKSFGSYSLSNNKLKLHLTWNLRRLNNKLVCGPDKGTQRAVLCSPLFYMDYQGFRQA